ncbi:MAG: glycosyltransferase [Candidatus Heimdallarchaeota archaeon]
MKRILMFSHSYVPDIRIDKEVKALFEEGYEIYLICSAKGKGQIPKYYKKVFFVPLTRMQKAFIPFSFRKPKKKYKEIIREISPNILHAHDIMAANIAFKVKPKNTKFIYEDHEVWELIKKLELKERENILKIPLRIYQFLAVKYLTKRIMKKADLNIVVQRHWIDFYKKRGIKENKIISIENFSSREMIEEALSEAKFVDEFIQNDSRKKLVHSSRSSKPSDDYLRNITAFAEAVNELENWVMVIFGPVDEKFEKLGVKFLPPRNVLEYLASCSKCDVMINPLVINERIHYCSPNRLYEATALGLRVFSPKAQAFYENFDDMLIWYDPKISNKEIVKILQNIDEYPTKKEIQEYSKKYHNWDNEAIKLIESYKRLY